MGSQCYLPPDTGERTLPQPQPYRSVLDLRTLEGCKAELHDIGAGYIPRWFSYPQTVAYPSSNYFTVSRTRNLSIVNPKS